MISKLIILFSIILLGVIPLAYGLAHPVPAMYIVNTSAGEFGTLSIDVGERFILTWAIANRGNVPMDNIVTQGFIPEGVTWVDGNNNALSNCTFNNITRILSCIVQEQMPITPPNTTSERYEFLFRGDFATIWDNSATVCGDWLGDAIFPEPVLNVCDQDGTFTDILAVTVTPEPAIYIVNTSDSIPSSLITDIGQEFVLVWGIENRGNVPLENVVTSSIIDEGVTFISSNNSNCTYDDSIRKLECVVQGTYISIGTISPIYDNIFVVDTDAPSTWANTATVCGEYLGVKYCDVDRTFETINLIEPDPITCPDGFTLVDNICISIIQPIDITSLNQIILDLEAVITQLELRIIALESKPTPVDLTSLENRITTLENEPTPTPVDLTPLENRITTLENEPDPEPIDLTSLENRVTALEEVWIALDNAWKSIFG